MGTDVAVFGSSEPAEDDPLYEIARRTGRLLAQSGFGVVNGGYGGVMEAVSRGAREAGGRAVGVTTRIFAARGSGNAYLSQTVDTPDLFERTRALMDLAAGYIILPGKAGTLAELATLWALHRAGLLGGRPIVLVTPFWNGFVDGLVARGALDPAQAAATRHAGTPEEAVEQIRTLVTPT